MEVRAKVCCRGRSTGGIAPGAQLHVLSVGVGDYGGAASHLPLKWAAEDAADIAAALSGQVGLALRPGFQMTLRNEEARGVAILDQLDRIRQRMGWRRAAATSRSSCSPATAWCSARARRPSSTCCRRTPTSASAARIQRSGISGTELRTAIAGLAAYGRVLVLLDTCSSGAAIGEGGVGARAPRCARSPAGT